MVIVLELLIMKTFSGCKDSEFSDIIATFVPKNFAICWKKCIFAVKKLNGEAYQWGLSVGPGTSDRLRSHCLLI